MVLQNGKWKKDYENASAINAGNCLGFVPTDIEQQHSPFNHLLLYNHNSACTLKIVLDAGIANQEIVGGKETFFVEPLSLLEIETSDEIFFDWVIVENTHASTNISAKEILVRISNF